MTQLQFYIPIVTIWGKNKNDKKTEKTPAKTNPASQIRKEEE